MRAFLFRFVNMWRREKIINSLYIFMFGPNHEAWWPSIKVIYFTIWFLFIILEMIQTKMVTIGHCIF